MSIVRSILYELQPCRLEDIIFSLKYIRKEAVELHHISKHAFSFSIKWLNQLQLKAFIRPITILLLWLLGYWFFSYLEFGSMFIILTMYAGIFLNLGERKAGEMSAYSVFNEGFAALPGTTTGEDFDRQIRHTDNLPGCDEDEDDWEIDEALAVANRRADRGVNPNPNPNNVARKTGKKARRTYEQRVLRKQQQRQEEEDFLQEAFTAVDREGANNHNDLINDDDNNDIHDDNDIGDDINGDDVGGHFEDIRNGR